MFKPKIYRLRKISLFPTLDRTKLYLVTETDKGYTCKIGEGQYMGFPKELVESGSKLFTPYSKEPHIEAKKNKNFKPFKPNNYVQRPRKVPRDYR